MCVRQHLAIEMAKTSVVENDLFAAYNSDRAVASLNSRNQRNDRKDECQITRNPYDDQKGTQDVQ